MRYMEREERESEEIKHGNGKRRGRGKDSV
jgi:hypothetical protein